MQRILLFTTLLTFAAWSADAAEVRLKSEAACSGAIVRLKDVAEIVSSDENEAAALAELQLFPVPSTGRVRSVRRGEIRELLALSGVKVEAVTITGAEKLVVSRSGSPAPVKPANSMLIPTAYVTPSTKFGGSAENAGVELVPVVIQSLQRGAVLKASDLELRPAAIQQAGGPLPLKIEELVGKELLRALPAGQQVVKEYAQSPRLVRRGDKVKVKAVAAGIVVTTDGKALEDGGENENVAVEELTSKEKLVTRVTARGSVEVLGTGVKRLR